MTISRNYDDHDLELLLYIIKYNKRWRFFNITKTTGEYL